jgi:tetratricopeptide (TPR) repeat protein
VSPRRRWPLWALLGAALLLRVALVASLEGKPFFYVPIVDSAAYDEWAWRIATQDFWGDRVFYQDPLYPYGLGLFYKVVGRDLLAARLAQAAIGTFGLWMLFEAVRRMAGYGAGLVALAIGAFYKPFAFYDAALLKDFLGVVAVEAALLFMALERRWKWLAFGAALGLGALVRGNLLLLTLGAAGFLAARRQWKPAAGVLAGTLLAVAPCTVRNIAVAGDFVLTTCQLGPNLYTGNNPENTTGRYRPPSFVAVGAPGFEEEGFRAEAERRSRRRLAASEVDAYWRGQAVDYVGDRPGTFLAVTGKRLIMLLSAYEIPDNFDMEFMKRFSWVLRLPLLGFGHALMPLAAAGMVLAWIERRTFALLYVLMAAYAASILAFFMFARYRLPLLPILVVFAAHGLALLPRLRRQGLRAIPKTAAAVLVGALLLAHVPWPESVVGHRDFRAAHYNLGFYYWQTERPADAAREFEAAAELNAKYLDDAAFAWTLAQAHERAGDEGRAFELYDRTAALDARSPEPAYRVGLIYFHREMYDRAAERLADAVRRDPGFGAAYVPLAEAARRLRRFDAALRHLEAGRSAVPQDWAIRLKRAEIFREVGMWKEALAAAEEALALKPGDPAATALRDEARRKTR